MSIITRISNKIIKFLIILLLLSISAIVSISIWLSIEPRNISYVDSLVNRRLAALAPEANPQVGEIELYFNIKQGGFVASLHDLRFEYGGNDIELSGITAQLNFIGLLPLSKRHLLNIKVESAELDFVKGEGNLIEPQKTATKRDFTKVLEDYVGALAKVDITLKDTLVRVPIAKSNGTCDIVNVFLDEALVHPIVHSGKTAIQVTSSLKVEEKEMGAYFMLEPIKDKKIGINGGLSNLSLNMLEKIYDLGLAVRDNINLEFKGIINSGIELERLNVRPIDSYATIFVPKHTKESIDVKKIDFNFSCYNNCQDINLEDLRLVAPEFTVGGSLKYNHDQLNVSLNSTGKLKVAKVLEAWPNDMLTSTKGWLDKSLRGGYIGKATFEYVKGPKEQQQDYLLSIDIVNSNLEYAQNMPPLEQITGTMYISPTDFKLTARNAIIANTKVGKVDAKIANLKSPELVEIGAKITGPVTDLVEIPTKVAESEPIEALKNLSGEADTNLSLVIPLNQEQFTLKDFRIKASSKVTGAIPKLTSDFNLNDLNLDADFATDRLNIKGSGLLNNSLYLTFDINNNFGESSENDSIIVHSEANANDYRNAGLSIPEFIHNQVISKLNILGKNHYALELNLNNANISADKFGITKRRGRIGNAYFEILTAGEDTIIKNYYVNLPTLKSRGRGTLSGDTITLLTSSYTKYGKGNFSFKYDYTYEKGTTLNIEGPVLDISKLDPNVFMEKKTRITKKNDKSPSHNRAVKVNTLISKLILKDSVEIIKPKFNLEHDGEHVKEVHFKGEIGSKRLPFILYYDYPVFSLVSEDAGSLLRGLGVYDNMLAGELQLKANLAVNGDVNGTLDIINFRLKKADILTKLLSISSLTSNAFLGLADLLQSSGISFRSLYTDFNYLEDRNAIAINDFNAQGPVLALDGKGFISMPELNLDFAGVLVPTNLINSLVKYIPFIGTTLSGGENSGLLATNFRVQGKMREKVNIKVNPLSLLTPGFLRGFLQKFPELEKQDKEVKKEGEE